MIRLSEIDRERFGVTSARADDVTESDLDAIEAFCKENRVKFLIARCNVDNILLVKKLEDTGFRLMDTLVYLKFNLVKKSLPPLSNDEYTIRLLQKGDEESIEAIAREGFTGYTGHYHTDPLLNQNKCNEAYIDWAVKSCAAKNDKDFILVAEHKSSVIGFLTIKDRSETTMELVLSGVATAYHRHGIYRLLIANGLYLAKEKNKLEVLTSTQITNIAVQKVWVRLGFEPDYGIYTFHKWYY